MKQSLLSLAIICIAQFVLSSCSKNSASDEEAQALANQQKKSEEFQAIVNAHRFRLVDFYSDKPIDYIETDTEVRSETDLKAYIKPYLLDDDNMFDGQGKLSIVQNTQKMPGVTDPILIRNYNVSHDKNNVFLDFVTYTYSPAKYKVSEYSPAGFVIYLDWPNGAKVFSRFQAVN
jgi:hypothetical protein